MPYVAPAYEVLHMTTARLQQQFNECLKRYVAPKFELLYRQCEQLEATYRQHVREKQNYFFSLTPDPIRLEEIACIHRLMGSLPVTPPDTAERHQVHNILLGALFYRRLIIDRSYSGLVGGAMYYVGWSSSNSSALYKTLIEILGITEINQLDELTIATCCEAYHRHLVAIDPAERSPFIPRVEVDLMTRLEAIVRDAEGRSHVVVRQIQRLMALNSFGVLLSNTDTETSAGLGVFAQALSLKLRIKEELTREDMMVCLLATSLAPSVKAMIGYILPDDMTLNKPAFKTFVATMKERLTVNSKYVFLGAYVLVLEGVPKDSAFAKALEMAIGVRPDNVLDEENQELMLTALDSYLSLSGMDTYPYYDAWGGYHVLRAQVGQQLADLQRVRSIMQPVADSMLT